MRRGASHEEKEKLAIGQTRAATLLYLLIKQGVCHTLALPFKKYLKAKEELYMETQVFQHAKEIIFKKKKKPSKRNQNPSRYYNNSIRTNLKFQTHKPKYIIFQKSSYKK
jgi:hypothetical protein